jgi:tetratricopeptide (TPR) repeat protein
MFRARSLVGDANARLRANDIAGASAAALSAREKSPEYDEAWVAFAATELAAARKTSALEALERAIELNPANKRQLPRNRAFESLWNDPEFRRLTGA